MRQAASPAVTGHAPPARPASLVVAPANDAAEREAEAVAETVLARAAAPPPVMAAPPAVQRACADCEVEEEKLHRAAAAGAATPALAPPAVHAGLASPSHGLDGASRAAVGPGLSAAAASARIHRGAGADRAARSVGARAFTVGRDIVFADGHYAPETPSGRALLAHELVHVAQQAKGGAMLQRACTHDGTPTNCHNWTIPLPPWIAGTIAHGQIASSLGIPPKGIPRATKLFMGAPSFPHLPRGYADLWRNNSASVSIGEIKSTATGSTVAAREAAHYVLRHDESMARGPVDPDDVAYHTDVGLMTKAGLPLNLSSFTSTGIALGPFAGDPLKQLWIEGDALGAVVYWCTGIGTLNPAWLVLLKKALKDLKKQLDALRETMNELIDGVIAGGRAVARWISGVIGDIVEWGEENSRVLALLALLVILVVAIVALIASILAEAPSAGTSTVGVVASVVALGASAAGILALLGFSTPGLPAAADTVARATFPEAADRDATGSAYDLPGDAMPRSVTAAVGSIPDAPGDQLLAALSPLTDIDAIKNAVTSLATEGFSETRGRRALTSGIAALRSAGDEAGAAGIEARMQSLGIA
ncbi:DUF4157 domain-containing protein [Elioraea sp.]|uniref:eCIS core domain-containing protein n=1 Tax=Elioraea sp. TaxID=2185103 RepID=UPI0025C4B77A|nr:DUF4157 domain-containing protein [Elioraea sp.]